ncbi:MAG: hypothetical protein JWO60_901 [Frankiales bacterium]|nr:hypothetical protein [Frankiales bacterium]
MSTRVEEPRPRERADTSTAAGALLAGLVAAAWWLLSASGNGAASLDGWADQTLFLQALLQAQTGADVDLSEAGTVGPGYVALGRLLGGALRLDAGAALVLLTRLAFLVLVLGVLTAAVRGSARRVRVEIAVLLGVALVVLLTPWRTYADVPWTHPVAAAQSLVAVLALRAVRHAPLAGGVALGASLVLLAQTRTFELQAVIAALALTGLLAGVASLVRRQRPDLRAAAVPFAGALLGGAASWLLVGSLTGYWRRFGQYQQGGREQALSLSPLDVPVKLVQLFVDPCFHSLCGPQDQYLAQGLSPDGIAQYWRQPLLMQLPFLLLTVLVLVVATGAVLRARRALPLDVQVSALAASALLLGYTANPIAGGAHLRYGFVRDFTCPAVLLLYAAARVTTEWLRGRDGALPRPGAGTVTLAGAAVLALVPGFALPRVGASYTDYALAPGSTCAQAAAAGCTLDLVARQADGATAPLGGRSVVIATCDGADAFVAVVVDRLGSDVVDAARDCAASGRASALQYLPVELGVYQTPEGDRLRRGHLLPLPS